ncbi:hypothetical protein ACTFIY_009402 [Dictyostelium cf. discoideum]
MVDFKNLCIFLIFLFFRLNNGQITPLTPTNSIAITPLNDFKFQQSPLFSSLGECSTIFGKFLVVDDNANNEITNILIIQDKIKIGSQSFQKEGNHYLFTFWFSLNFTVSPLQMNITISSNSTSDVVYSFTQTCVDHNLNLLELENPITILAEGSFITKFKLKNYSYGSTLLTYNNGFPSFTALDNGSYLIVWDGKYVSSLTNLYDDWGFDILFYKKNKTFTIPSYFSFDKQLYDPTYNKTFYPNDIMDSGSNYTEFGQDYPPVLTDNVKTNIPYPFSGVSDLNYLYLQKPLKGKIGNMTYVNIIYTSNKYNSGDALNFVYYDQYQNQTSKTPFVTKINKFDVQNLGNIVLSNTTSKSPIIELYTVSFKNIVNYKFTIYQYTFDYKNFLKTWPYGFIKGSNSDYIHKTTVQAITKRFSSFSTINYSIQTFSQLDGATIAAPKGSSTGLKAPTIVSYRFYETYTGFYILSVDFISENGLDNAYSSSLDINPGLLHLVSGSIYNGTLDFIFAINESPEVTLNDIYDNTFFLNEFDIISINPLSQYKYPNQLYYKFNISNFYNISFSANNLNLEKDNYITVYLCNKDLPTDTTFIFYNIEDSSYTAPQLISKTPSQSLIYNSTIGCFNSRLIIQKNSIFFEVLGIFYSSELSFFYSSMLPKSSRLFIKKSELDAQGPVFSFIKKINDKVDVSSNSVIVGWDFTISDQGNGFSHGYIKIMGSVDSSTYHYNFTIDDIVEGDKFNGVYQFVISVSTPCVSQEYSITNVELYDTNNVFSIFELYTSKSFSAYYSNPFINFYQSGIDITKVSFTCTPSILDTTDPILKSFTVSKDSIDVGSNDRSIVFNFEIETNSTGTGLKIDQLPIVYIISLKMKILECRSTLLSNNATNYNYTCQIELPVSFGHPYPISYSLYGIVNNGGNFNGFTTEDLKLKSLPYYSNTTFSTDIPVVMSNHVIYSDIGGDLFLEGRGFSNSKNVEITYSQVGLTSQNLVPTIIGHSIIKVTGIKPTAESIFVKVETDNYFSNSYTVYPIFFNETIPEPPETPTPTPTPTPTQIPTASPLPTNPPQQCKDLCGGSNKGYCSPTGCICYSPWVGETCSSQVIIVPPPKPDTGFPTTQFPDSINSNPNNSSDSENTSKENENNTPITFKSLISIVSLREIDYKGEVVVEHKFEKWYFTPITELKSQYITTINNNTNVTATLEWFNKSTTIQFANENLEMNPSTIKYSIEISQYNFKQNLNNLQLIMFASFDASDPPKDICSSKQFGNTSSGDNSNYIKIQIDNHSLYGRFIKRAIIDDKVYSIENQLLDSSLNSISNSSSVQSYIGITIPFYKNYVVVDPDFSVLVDSKSASSSSTNSMCNSSSSGLSKSQLIGIIIGAACFAIAIVVVIVYVARKRHVQKLFVEKYSSRMKSK